MRARRPRAAARDAPQAWLPDPSRRSQAMPLMLVPGDGMRFFASGTHGSLCLGRCYSGIARTCAGRFIDPQCVMGGIAPQLPTLSDYLLTVGSTLAHQRSRWESPIITSQLCPAPILLKTGNPLEAKASCNSVVLPVTIIIESCRVVDLSHKPTGRLKAVHVTLYNVATYTKSVSWHMSFVILRISSDFKVSLSSFSNGNTAAQSIYAPSRLGYCTRRL